MAGKAPVKRATPAKTTARPVSATPSQNKTVEIRKIENGFIVRESSYSERGGYKSKETFSKTPPKIVSGG